MAEVPLWGRDDTIRAVAIVDDADWPAVSQYRWHLSSYPQTHIQHRLVRLHRFLMGDPPRPGLMVDHRNQDPLDNRRRNLRWVTNAINKQNGGAHRDSTSAYRGVSWNRRRRKWVAQAVPDGRYHFLGHFEQEEDAAEAVCRFWAQFDV